MMSSWTLCEAALPRKVYRRPLGTSELGFYWDGEFAGTSDTLQHVLGELRSTEHRALLSSSNLARAWVELKQRFPILASSVDLQPGDEGVTFTVDAEHLQYVRPGELNIEEVGSAQDVEDFNEALITGTRQLSAQLPAKLWILLRRDSWRHFHVITHVAHMIADGLSNAILLREFFNLLCGASMDKIPSRLEDRLALSLPMEYLHPQPKMSIARRKWRLTIASVMATLRSEKLQGGHTLPRMVTPNTIYTPARSRLELFAFPTDTSMRILTNCRKSQITFGHALPVLAQIAQARILHRLRRQNKVNDVEWKHRLQQPMHFEGPRSLRSYLQPDWFSSGGFDGVGVLCSNFTNTLPFMPSRCIADTADGVPSYAGLMTRERFLHRSKFVKEDIAKSCNHPLVYEFSMLFHQRRSLESKEVALTWQGLRDLGWISDAISQTPPIAEYPGRGGTIFANGGSSMGNLDLLFPTEYPLPSKEKTSTQPMVRATLSTNRLRCRPKELYLGSYMAGRKIHLLVFWDNNVYEREMVQEWLEEVKLATEYYLGETAQAKDRFDTLMSRL